MIRRRQAKDNSDDVQAPAPADSSPEKQLPPAVAKPKNERKQSFITKPKSKRRNGLIFLLGGVFGIFCAVFFAQQQDVISLDSLMDLNIDSLMDVIPQSIMRDAREFSVCYCLEI
jgi:phospholipid:diacylglycerol acyltransferase